MGLQQCRLDSGVQPCDCTAQHSALLEGQRELQPSSWTFSPLKSQRPCRWAQGARVNFCCPQPQGETSTMTWCAFGSSVLEKQRAEQNQYWKKQLRRVPYYEMTRLTQLHSGGCRDKMIASAEKTQEAKPCQRWKASSNGTCT